MRSPSDSPAWSSGPGEVSLERLCELIVAEHDYDLACLAMADGDRRYANLRKLARLAAEFEAVRGPDLEGFIRFCDEQATLAAREGEAAIAEEGRDAIVLMTVHAAKGLEFDVVVLADQGRERAARGLPDVLVSSDGRVALRAPDANGVLRPAIGYTAASKAEREAEREEGRRLQYVAMTRARQHLIVSGALLPGEQTSIAEVCRLLEVGLDDEGDIERGDARLAVRVTRPVAHVAAGNGAPKVQVPAAEPGAEVGAQLALFTDGGRVAAPLVPLAEIPPAAPVPVRRLSYSALALYGRCGYRYFAQRVLGLPEPVVVPEPDAGLGPLEVGDAVHLELERPDGRWRDLYPRRDRGRRGADRRVRRGLVGVRAPRARRRPRPLPARGAVRVRGGRRAVPRPVRHLRARGRRLGAGRRLQDEPARPTARRRT